MAEREKYLCPICNRYHIQDYMSHHHLYPTVNNLEKDPPTIYICLTCHSVIHFCHTNEELRNEYNSINRLISSEKIKNMLELYKYKADNCIFKIKRLKYLLKCA